MDSNSFHKQNSTPEPDFELIETENYKGGGVPQFNHQMLIMEVLRRCNEAGSHEMRAGWYNEKVDGRGNVTRTYIEDTRSKFIECVKTAKMNLSCDFDKTATENIKKLEEDLEKELKILLLNQFSWWDSLTLKYKQQQASIGRNIESKEFFNENLGWYQMWITAQVECYRNIFEELILLTERLDFYEGVEYTA